MFVKSSLSATMTAAATAAAVALGLGFFFAAAPTPAAAAAVAVAVADAMPANDVDAKLAPRAASSCTYYEHPSYKRKYIVYKLANSDGFVGTDCPSRRSAIEAACNVLPVRCWPGSGTTASINIDVAPSVSENCAQTVWPNLPTCTKVK